MTLSELKNKKIAIWGLGKEGLESYRFLRTHFPTKTIILANQHYPETMPDDENDDHHVKIILEGDLLNHTSDIDLVIKSPGISLYHPLVTALKQEEIVITSATNIWFAQDRKATVIAVTGSNGKSTTCAMLHHILTGLGLKSALGGNIGTALLSLNTDADYYIVELSSYQTADLNYAPDIALVLNLFPEHIQWHQSHEQYFQDKSRLIRLGAKANILNKTDPLTAKIIMEKPENTLWFNDPATLHKEGNLILSGDEILGAVQDVSLRGGHNHENICAALTLCKSLNLNLKDCFNLAATFPGLPHRMEDLGQIEDITYINDSISTTPEATIAALKSFEGRKITLILGGQNRKQDHSQLIEYIVSRPQITIITAYETGPLIHEGLLAMNYTGPQYIASDLGTAIQIAKKNTPIGGIVLLSPAAPSYDAFTNFEQRGMFFKKNCGL